MPKLSSIIAYQLPDFVRTDHELYTLFVQTYFDWLDESGNYSYFLQNYLRNLDVDIADDDFVDAFMRELAGNFPPDILIDKSQLIKIIREFYLARGSEQSFRFIFTILYNSDITIEYPRELIQTSSGGDFSSDDIMYSTGNNIFKLNISDLSSIFIVGETSGAEAVIDSITTSFFNEQKIIKYNISSFTDGFVPGEDVTLTVDDVTVTETLFGLVSGVDVLTGGSEYNLDDVVAITGDGIRAKGRVARVKTGSLTSINITNAGTGYELGDRVQATPQLGSKGFGFNALVSSVGGLGEIESLDIINMGYKYSKSTIGTIQSSGVNAIIELTGSDIGAIDELEIFDSGYGYTSASIDVSGGSGATFDANISAVFNSPKEYKDEDDWLSGYSKIQDSYYYQHFSYAIRSDVSPDKWIETVKRIAHPVGSELFGIYETIQNVNTSLSIAPTTRASLSSLIFLLNSVDQPVINTNISGAAITIDIFSESAYSLDLRLSDLDDIKFFSTFAYDLGDFVEYSIEDIENFSIQLNRQDGATIIIT